MASDSMSIVSDESRTSTDAQVLAEINAPPPPPPNDSNGMVVALKVASVSIKLLDSSAQVWQPYFVSCLHAH